MHLKLLCVISNWSIWHIKCIDVLRDHSPRPKIITYCAIKFKALVGELNFLPKFHMFLGGPHPYLSASGFCQWSSFAQYFWMQLMITVSTLWQYISQVLVSMVKCLRSLEIWIKQLLTLLRNMDEACLVSQHVLWTHPKVMRHYCFTPLCITAIPSAFILRQNKYFLHDTGFISTSDTEMWRTVSHQMVGYQLTSSRTRRLMLSMKLMNVAWCF